MKPKVIIESPYKGNVEQNLTYLRRCLRDASIVRGENPMASHMFFTQFLDDNIPEERALGIECGLQWAERVQVAAFYVDYGWSDGMLKAKERHERENRRIEIRHIGNNP